MSKLEEGERRLTDLPSGQDHIMVEEKRFGVHTIAIEKLGIEASKVRVSNYPAWTSAFDAAMDKAGI
jgi:hypothetical protein